MDEVENNGVDPFAGHDDAPFVPPVGETPPVPPVVEPQPNQAPPVVDQATLEQPVTDPAPVEKAVEEVAANDVTATQAAPVLQAADSTANHGHGVLDEVLSLAQFWGGEVAIEVKRLLDKAKALYDKGVVTAEDGAQYTAFIEGQK